MKFYATAADFCTLFRLVAAVVVVYMGLTQGAAALPHVVTLVVLAWITDGLDGPLARRSNTPTHFGKYEFAVDVLLTWATFAYLTLAGFVPWRWAVLYTILAMVVVALAQRKAVLVAFMRPIDLTSGLIALRHAPEITLLFVAWLVGLGLVRWRQTKVRVKAWLLDLASLLKRDR